MDVGYTHGTHLQQPVPDLAPTVDYLPGTPTNSYVTEPSTQQYYLHPATSGYYLTQGSGALVNVTA